MSLDLGWNVGIGSDGAAELHHRDVVACGAQTGAVAIDLERPEGDLGAERGRLGVNAVGAADHHGVAVLPGEAHHGGQQLRRCLDQEIGGVAQRPAQRGVDDIGRGEAVVDPRRRWCTDRRLDDIDEGSDVVIGDRFAIEHGLHELVVGHGRLLAAGGGILGRNDPERGVALGGEQFDFEPTTESLGIGPHSVHFGGGVARNHDTQTR